MGRKGDKDREAQLGLDDLFTAAAAPTERAAAERAAAERAEPEVYSVGEIVRLASRALEQRFRAVWVEGEVSNCRRMASGHVFFTLKDGGAQLQAVMFRSDAGRLKFELKNGDAVRCRGTLRIYDAQGKFQLYVDRAEPAGLGELMLAYEELKARLAAEGLFAEERKRPLPAVPRVIGVVTSPTGAAVRDIIQVALSRCPVRIIVSPTPVQGAEAPPRIVEALERLTRREEVEVVIIGRGGGSLEDLWCFNDERVARAVAACPVPIVSAVGHEVDFTLCDYVADRRAATPSAAAEIVVPDHRALVQRLRGPRDRLRSAMRRMLDVSRLRLRGLERGLGDPRPLLLDARATLDGLVNRLTGRVQDGLRGRRQALSGIRERVAAAHPQAQLVRRRGELTRLRTALGHGAVALIRGRSERLTALAGALALAGQAAPEGRRQSFALLAARLGELSPLRVLSRGYSVTVDRGGRALRSYDEVAVGDPVRVRLAAGALGCEVTSREPPEPTELLLPGPNDSSEDEKFVDPGSGDGR